jgi:hypothetical protein
MRIQALSLVLATCLAGGAGATEHTTFSLLTFPPAGPDRTDCIADALLSTPPGWQAGDAAVLLAAPAGPGDAARDRLVAGLLEEGAAVAEAAIDGAVDCAWTAPGAEPAAMLAGALQALRTTAGAGLTVVIAFGPAGGVALTPAAWPPAAPVAALWVGPAGVAIRAAAAAPAGEAWPQRIAPFCARVAAALEGVGEEGRCAAALAEGALLAAAP